MPDDAGRAYDPAKDATAQEPLTANEQRLVTRLLGDPFAFPMEFKAWLRGWLEEQFPRIGSLAVAAESGAAGAFVPPPGAILDYAGSTAPGGYVLCDGAEYDRTSLVYQRLFNAIGFTYGTGSTGNMFRVPDLQGRLTVGKGLHADVSALALNEGLAVASRRPKHRHTVTDPGHGHNMYARGSGAGGYWGTDPIWADGDAISSVPLIVANSTGISVGNTGDSLDAAPYLVVNKIISLGS